MDIVLDSNIFRGDFLLRSKDFEVLMDFLAKTRSAVVMPKNMIRNKRSYSRALKERLLTHNNAVGNINLALTNNAKHLTKFELDVPGEVQAYESFLKGKLAIYGGNKFSQGDHTPKT